MKYKLKSNFTTEVIEGDTYILPYGQNIAMQKRGVKLNSTGEYLWNLLQRTTDYDDIYENFCHYYEAYSNEEKALLRTDLDAFLTSMQSYGILREEKTETKHQTKWEFDVKIGGLGIRLCFPQKYIYSYFLDFMTDDLPNHFISVYLEPFYSKGLKDGQILIRTEEMLIIQRERMLIFDFKTNDIVKELSYDLDEKKAYIHMTDSDDDDKAKEEIFLALRSAFLYYATKHHRFALHSASIIYKGKAFLFSGASGAGKSTHTGLWKKLFDVKDLNGDLNLLGVEENRPVVYGMPWCGTSGIYRNESYPLGGIVFLTQGSTEEILPLGNSERVLYIMQRMVSCDWTKEGMEASLELAKQIASSGIGIWNLQCTKNDSAAYFMKKEIDKWES